MKAPLLTTDRLVLRSFQDGDIDHLVREIMDDARSMAMFFEDPRTDDEKTACAQRFVESYSTPWAQHGFGGWAVCSRGGDLGAADTFLGFCGFEVGELRDAGAELGYGYGRSCHRKGIGPEAAKAAIDWYFSQTGFDKTYACIHPDNDGSRKVLERSGLIYSRDEDLWGSVEKGVGKLPVFTLDKTRWKQLTGN